MSVRIVRDLLAEYSDSGAVPISAVSRLSPAERRDIDSTLALIRLLKLVLTPVEPSPEFAALLRAELMAASLADARTGGRRVFRLVVGAVAVSSLVSAAALYFFSRTRTHRRAA